MDDQPLDYHQQKQHQIGEKAFEERDSIHLLELANEFSRRSPFQWKL
jgi:hypothetical protein